MDPLPRHRADDWTSHSPNNGSCCHGNISTLSADEMIILILSYEPWHS